MRRSRGQLLALLAASRGLGCSTELAAPPGHLADGWGDRRGQEQRSGEPIEPLPRAFVADLRLARLGAALFASPALSDDGRVTCASCHAAEHGMADGKARSELAGGGGPPLNAPTLYNVRLLFRLNWAGKYETLPEHLDSLIDNPNVLGTSWAAIVERLRASAEWRRAFEEVFGQPPSETTARRALVEYERSLVTPDAPFDRWLRGESGAIDADARRGYELFESYGCSSCHQGVLAGGNMFQRLGVMREYYDDETSIQAADLGRYELTGRPEDRHVFRVPSLRNVALTAPYLHDGSAPTLGAVIRIMGLYQLGRSIGAEDSDQITAFLRSLTGVPRGLDGAEAAGLATPGAGAARGGAAAEEAKAP